MTENLSIETEQLRNEIHGLREDITKLTSQLHDYTANHGQKLAVLTEWQRHVDDKITTLFDLNNAHVDVHRSLDCNINEIKNTIVKLETNRNTLFERVEGVEASIKSFGQRLGDTDDKIDALINKSAGMGRLLAIIGSVMGIVGVAITIIMLVK